MRIIFPASQRWLVSLGLLIGILVLTFVFYNHSDGQQNPAPLQPVPTVEHIKVPDVADMSPAFKKGSIVFADFLRVSGKGHVKWLPFLKFVVLKDKEKAKGSSSFSLDDYSRFFDPKFSPDGKKIMFRAGDFGYRHSMHQLCFLDRASQEVQEGPERLVYLRAWWSPNSNYVAYIRGGDVEGNETSKPLELCIYDVKSQESRSIALNAMVKYLAWSADDTLLYTVKHTADTDLLSEPNIPFAADIYTVSAKGGKPKLFIENGFDPRPSRDGKKIAFFAWSSELEKVRVNSKLMPQLGLYLYDIETKQRTLLHPSFSHVQFGDLMWLHDNRRLVYFQTLEPSPQSQYQFGIIDTSDVSIQKLPIFRANDYEEIPRLATRPQISLLNISKDDKHLYFAVSEYIGDDGSLAIEEMVLQALDLSTYQFSVGARIETSDGIDWRNE